MIWWLLYSLSVARPESAHQTPENTVCYGMSTRILVKAGLELLGKIRKRPLPVRERPSFRQDIKFFRGTQPRTNGSAVTSIISSMWHSV